MTESKLPTRITEILIRPLNVEDAGIVSVMLLAQRTEYARFFYAFEFSEEHIAQILSRRIKDVYSGLFWQGELVGIFMLRGWDDGYEVPSFGVFVDEKYRGGAFMKISLELAKLICRLSGCRRLRATIHPDNVSSRGAIRLGFVESGGTTEAGNIIYHMDL
ncbi:MAG TPA: GNAT family N-acetyltransferase [Pyrinomonadaceae bacterium]